MERPRPLGPADVAGTGRGRGSPRTRRLAGGGGQGRRTGRGSARSPGHARRRRGAGRARRVRPDPRTGAGGRPRTGRPLRGRRPRRPGLDGRRLDLDLVIVLGLAEGTFPGPVRDDSLLPDHERAAAGASCHCGASASNASTASCSPRWPAPAGSCCASPAATCGGAANACRRAGSSPWRPRSTAGAGGARTCSAGNGRGSRTSRRSMPVCATWASRRPSRSTDCGRCSPHRTRPGRFPRASPTRSLAPAWSPARPGAATASPASTATWPGFPSPHRSRSPPPPPGSRRWANCPFAYLVQELLGVDAVENPEDRLEIAPIDRGRSSTRSWRSSSSRCWAGRRPSSRAGRSLVARRPGAAAGDRGGGL